MTEEKEKWLEVLSGRAIANPTNEEEVEAAKLREAIGAYEQGIGLNKITADNSYFRFQQLMKASNTQRASSSFLNKLKKYKWETLRLIAATATGIAIATLPTMQLATTRGEESVSIWNNFSHLFNTADEAIKTEITLHDNNPLNLSREIIFSCISVGVEVKVKNDNQITLIVYNLKSLDEKQIPLKAVLGLSDKAEGNVKVTIIK